MKNKSLFFKLFVGLSVSSFLIGCSNKNNNNSEEKKDEPTPADTTNYDDGFIDGYLHGFDGKLKELFDKYRWSLSWKHDVFNTKYKIIPT